jgi:uncharacterized membrane protein (UPF0127 family)
MRLALLRCALLAAAPLTACAMQNSPWVEVKGQRFEVEIAADDASRTRGLMFRESLPAERGMLFIFEREEPLAFWMKNTRIPLDILYFDASRRLVSVAQGVPPCRTPQCPNYPSAGPARFTLELQAGMAKQLRLQPGDEMIIDPATSSAHHLD